MLSVPLMGSVALHLTRGVPFKRLFFAVGDEVSRWRFELICLLTDLLAVTPHTPSPEPVKYDKKDGQWYSHDGGDSKETQQRKGKRS